MELVKAQHPRFFGDFGSHGFQRIGFAFQGAQPLVDFRHKSMKMHAAFTSVGQAAEEGIHQKTFSPAHAAVEIQTFRQLRRTQAAS